MLLSWTDRDLYADVDFLVQMTKSKKKKKDLVKEKVKEKVKIIHRFRQTTNEIDNA